MSAHRLTVWQDDRRGVGGIGRPAIHERLPEVSKRVFETLIANRYNQDLMTDSTIVRAHQQAVTGTMGRN